MRRRIVENIARPSQNFKLFIKTSTVESKKLLEDLERIKLTIETMHNSDRHCIEHVFRHGVEHHLVEWATKGFRGGSEYVCVTEYLSRTVDALSSVLDTIESQDYDMYYIKRYLSWAVDYAQKALNRYSDPEVEKVLNDIDEFYRSGELFNSWNDEFEEDNKEFPIEATDLVGLVPKVHRDISFLLSKIIEHSMALLYQLRGETPPHEDAEILFHASVAARELYYEGFSKTGARHAAGLGQFGSVFETTSFTSAEWLAREIARCLLEAVFIAHRQITIEDVIQHAKIDGVLDKLEQSYESGHGIRLKAVRTLEHTMDAYRWYLAYAEGAEKRYNPLFVGDMEKLMNTLRDVDPENVGYTATNVDMTNSNIEFISSMYEYRVPPAAILENEYWVQAETDWV